VKAIKRFLVFVLVVGITATMVAHPSQLSATAEAKEASAVGKHPESAQWSLQVMLVDPGEVNLSRSFQIAIYESLLEELSKTKKFKRVLRDGESVPSEDSDLLILKTTVEKYTAGSETQRAVTTVSGATKLTVNSQLCRRDGRVLFQSTVGGKVLFMGSNLRATHNLARNLAKKIEESPLSNP
jgi:hypothetical protein